MLSIAHKPSRTVCFGQDVSQSNIVYFKKHRVFYSSVLAAFILFGPTTVNFPRSQDRPESQAWCEMRRGIYLWASSTEHLALT